MKPERGQLSGIVLLRLSTDHMRKIQPRSYGNHLNGQPQCSEHSIFRHDWDRHLHCAQGSIGSQDGEAKYAQSGCQPTHQCSAKGCDGGHLRYTACIRGGSGRMNSTGMSLQGTHTHMICQGYDHIP